VRHLSIVVAALIGFSVGSRASAFTIEEIDRASQSAAPRINGLVKQLASDRVEGRNNDSPGSLLAQQYILTWLRRYTVGINTAASGDDAYKQPFVQDGKRGTNLLGVIRGRELPDEYVFVGGHYDHLGRRCEQAAPPDDDICNGATDNAAGSAAVTSIARAIHALPTAPRRSIVIALWDAEEDGLAGSLYYVEHPLIALAQTVAYVNIDLIGANLLPSVSDISFAVGAETGGEMFRSMTREAIAPSWLHTQLVSYIFGQGRSDHKNFVEKRIPTVFFGDSTGACYHTTGDELRKVDWKKLRAQSQIAFRLTVALTESDTRLTFASPDIPAVYDDAVAVHRVLTQGLEDITIFPPDVQTMLTTAQQQLSTTVAEGPAAFDAPDIALTLITAANSIEALTELPCQ
jgi:hypothetical protein